MQGSKAWSGTVGQAGIEVAQDDVVRPGLTRRCGCSSKALGTVVNRGKGTGLFRGSCSRQYNVGQLGCCGGEQIQHHQTFQLLQGRSHFRTIGQLQQVAAHDKQAADVAFVNGVNNAEQVFAVGAGHDTAIQHSLGVVLLVNRVQISSRQNRQIQRTGNRSCRISTADEFMAVDHSHLALDKGDGIAVGCLIKTGGSLDLIKTDCSHGLLERVQPFSCYGLALVEGCLGQTQSHKPFRTDFVAQGVVGKLIQRGRTGRGDHQSCITLGGCLDDPVAETG